MFDNRPEYPPEFDDPDPQDVIDGLETKLTEAQAEIETLRAAIENWFDDLSLGSNDSWEQVILDALHAAREGE